MSSSSQVPDSWIASFCGLTGHEYFAEVSEDFIEDDFNLTGLQLQVMMYKEALEMILDVEPEEEEDEEEEEEEDEEEDDILGEDKPNGYRRTGDRRHLRIASDLSVIESSAELLYGLIHQRYICSRPGIQQMAEKFDLQHFGTCPRVHCNGAKVLPVGCSDVPGEDTVKLFCPSCLDIYTPPNSRFQTVDGAFFGTTFPTLFFMTFPELDVRSYRTVSTGTPVPTSGMTITPALSSITANGLVSTLATSTHLNNATTTNSNNNNTITSTNNNSVAIPNQPAVINGVVTTNIAPGLGAGNIYEPKIYGFRVSERSKSGPRMQWLRMRPTDMTVLDERTRFLADHGDDDIIEEDGSLEEDDEDLVEERDEEGRDDGNYRNGKGEVTSRLGEGRMAGEDIDTIMKTGGEEDNKLGIAMIGGSRSTFPPPSDRRRATPRTRRREYWDLTNPRRREYWDWTNRGTPRTRRRERWDLLNTNSVADVG